MPPSKEKQSSTVSRPFAAFSVDRALFRTSVLESVVDGCIDKGLIPADAVGEVIRDRIRLQKDGTDQHYQMYARRLVSTLLQHTAGMRALHFMSFSAELAKERPVPRFEFPEKLLQAVRAKHHIVAVSGTPTVLVRPYLSDLPIGSFCGSTLEQDDGNFTGRLNPIGDRAAPLKRLIGEETVQQAGSLAIGSTVADIPMLHFARVPVMFNATPGLAQHGKQLHWLRIEERNDEITALEYSHSHGDYREIDPLAAIHKVYETAKIA